MASLEPGWEGGDYFTTTRWTVVRASAGPDDPDNHAAALEQLCRTYWRPVFAFVCRRGYPPADAQDLTQDFFARLLAGTFLDRADPAKGRFRAYLLGALEYALADARDRARALKRGGRMQFISLDEFREEREHPALAAATADTRTPGDAFEVRWAQSLIARSLARLREGLAARGRPELYPVLEPFLTGAEPAGAYARAAARLGLSLTATKVTIHRLRNQYRAVLREEVAHTLRPATPAAIEEELRHLAAVLVRAGGL